MARQALAAAAAVELCYDAGMKTRAPSRPGAYTIGRDRFAKISEVEGIKPSRRLQEEFREFDRKGLSAAERRHILARKYAEKS
ncbi:MAG TPA: hypothetical protein VHU18_13460 [Rhizomicrobium sp.]|nr:hypothetical protein [Rhizomicrobium sp.]